MRILITLFLSSLPFFLLAETVVHFTSEELVAKTPLIVIGRLFSIEKESPLLNFGSTEFKGKLVVSQVLKNNLGTNIVNGTKLNVSLHVDNVELEHIRPSKFPGMMLWYLFESSEGSFSGAFEPTNEMPKVTSMIKKQTKEK